MPTKNGRYNVTNDNPYDLQAPLHSELAFQHGINFEIKVSDFEFSSAGLLLSPPPPSPPPPGSVTNLYGICSRFFFDSIFIKDFNFIFYKKNLLLGLSLRIRLMLLRFSPESIQSTIHLIFRFLLIQFYAR